MNIDAHGIAVLIDAIGVPAALLVGIVFLFLKYPPRPPVTPEADLLAELRKLTDAVTGLQSTMVLTQGKLSDEVGELAVKIAEINGRLSR